MVKKTWRLDAIWNQALDQQDERKSEPRDRLYASELGRSDIDTFLKLKGEVPTNPPNSRSKRKFESGNVWEWIVRLVLVRAGILVGSQNAVRFKIDDDCLEVSGRLDFIAGGHPDYQKGLEELSLLNNLVELPPMIYRAVEKIILYFQENYPDGMDEKLLEIKSVSSFAMDRVEKLETALNGHDLQLFHYVRGLKTEGAICYICRDDCRMFEIPVLYDDQRLLERYNEKIRRMSKFYFDDVMPDKEPLIIFEKETYRFSKNFNVEYSPFLTKLYGFERPDSYDEQVSPLIGRWNRVITRIKDDKEMTKNNLEALQEMARNGFNVAGIIENIKKNPKAVLDLKEESE